MTNLEVLNVVMEKLGHGRNVPMRLNINVDGVSHEIAVDRGHSEIQYLVHGLIIELLKEEMARTSRMVKTSKTHLEGIPKEAEEDTDEYEVKVLTGWDPTLGECYETLKVTANSPRDACVMAYIMIAPDCPEKGTPEEIVSRALKTAEIVE